MIVDRPSEMGEDVPEHLRDEPFLRRKIRVSKDPSTGKQYAENAYIETVTSAE